MRDQIATHRSGKTRCDNLDELHHETGENGKLAGCGHAANPLGQTRVKRAVSGKLSSKK
jgi:hypothetical protein